MRTLFDLFLLAAAAVLVVVGITSYPEIHVGVLAGIIAAAALLLAPIGTRTAGAVNA